MAKAEYPSTGWSLDPDKTGTPDPLSGPLAILKRMTMYLRRSAIVAFMLTSLNCFLTLLCVIRLYVYPGVLLVNASSLFVALLILVLYERLRKRGDALFEEISDEFQSYIALGGTEEKVASTDYRPPLGWRVVLRSFARTTDLPLVPGKFGPAVYAAINMALAILQAYFLFVRRPH